MCFTRESSICMRLSLAAACLGAFISGAMGYAEETGDDGLSLRGGTLLPAEPTCSRDNTMHAYYGWVLKIAGEMFNVALTDCLVDSTGAELIDCKEVNLPGAHFDPSMADPGAWGDWSNSRAACVDIMGIKAQELVRQLCHLGSDMVMSELTHGAFSAEDAEIYSSSEIEGGYVFVASFGQNPVGGNVSCIAKYLYDRAPDYINAVTSDSARISALRTQAVGEWAATITVIVALSCLGFHHLWMRTHGGEAPSYASVCEEWHHFMGECPGRTVRFITQLYDCLMCCCRSNRFDPPGTFSTSRGGYCAINGDDGTRHSGSVALTRLSVGAREAASYAATSGSQLALDLTLG